MSGGVSLGRRKVRLVVERNGMAARNAVDRNWDELLQELRVTQTGLQILTGFLVLPESRTREPGGMPGRRPGTPNP